jgi:predicted pyridoxine 5'-phosphate oxidase superfamily flavin-nucleotide-binding protein
MKMSPEIQQAVAECGPALVATASKSGKPDVSAKGSFRVLDDEHVMFADVASPQTIANLTENPQVSAICLKDRHGVRIWGKAEILTEGDLFDQMAQAMAARQMTVKHLVKIAVEEATLF